MLARLYTAAAGMSMTPSLTRACSSGRKGEKRREGWGSLQRVKGGGSRLESRLSKDANNNNQQPTTNNNQQGQHHSYR
jgi:hypothetical protein